MDGQVLNELEFCAEFQKLVSDGVSPLMPEGLAKIIRECPRTITSLLFLHFGNNGFATETDRVLNEPLRNSSFPSRGFCRGFFVKVLQGIVISLQNNLMELCDTAELSHSPPRSVAISELACIAAESVAAPTHTTPAPEAIPASKEFTARELR